MAERTIRKRRGAGSVTVISAGEPTPNNVGEPSANVEPDAVELSGVVEPTTIDDYNVDEPIDGLGDTFVDPASATGSSSDTGTGRKRRSDSGTRRGGRRSRASASETTNSIANLLFSVRLGMANMLRSEILPLTPEESQQYAKAITNLSQYYDIPIVSEKALAWVNLATTIAAIEGPRFMAAKMNKRNKQPKVVTFEQPVVKANQGD